MTSISIPRMVMYALAVLTAGLHEFKEIVEPIKVIGQCGLDGVLDLALLYPAPDPGVRFRVPNYGIDPDREGVIGKEKVNQSLLRAVVSPLWVLGVGFLSP